MDRCIARTPWRLAVTWVLAVSVAGFGSEATADAEPGPPEEAEVISSSLGDSDPLFDEDEPDPLFDDDEPGPNDPIEETNRAVLGFNSRVDQVLWKPLGKAYRFIVPDPAETALANALWNLESGAILMNNLFQGRPVDAARTLGRFLVNTTVGIGGLLDPAGAIGLKREESDFGQTLGRWGVGPGPYLVVPFVGPATVRDGFGGVTDSFMNPLTYVIGPGGNLFLGVALLNFGKGIAVQERYRGELEALKQGSVDYYAALRSLYLQSREGSIQEAIEASNRTPLP